MSDPGFNPRAYAADEVLRDGTAIHIRAIAPSDKELLFEHFSGLSPESRYTRFFGAKRTLSRDELARFTELDFDNQVGLTAEMLDDGRERFIGIGRYFRSPERSRAEVAFAVLDQYQGRGIATLLLEHLRRIAHQAGIEEFVADVMASNTHMLDVFRDSGFQRKSHSQGGVVHVSLRTDHKVGVSS
ncbi:MAG TPA: GNAT family N-acetyltransferase [Candidatus Binataceae bacterium]|nr:GNAT family N-acetyltransferase [Candidatus Binataceae bacterium]